jgi:hypothetical protein
VVLPGGSVPLGEVRRLLHRRSATSSTVAATLYGVVGEGDGQGGLVPVLVVVDLQIEGVVEGALQVFWSAGEARFDLG